jgi:hypothetical protein
MTLLIRYPLIDHNLSQDSAMHVLSACLRDSARLYRPYLYERGSEDVKDTPLVLPLPEKEIYRAPARILSF